MENRNKEVLSQVDIVRTQTLSLAGTLSPKFKRSSDYGFFDDNNAFGKKQSMPTVKSPMLKKQFLNKDEEKKEKTYPETKIKIIHDIHSYDHYKKHPVNIFSNYYNEFVRTVFKNKNISKSNMKYIIYLSNAVGLNLKREHFSD